MPSAFALRVVASIVSQGGVIAYPTEAVYGLGCDPARGDAVARILELKRRSVQRGLILIAADLSQLADYLVPLSAGQRARIESGAPITWVAPASRYAPAWITGQYDSVAVRVTHHPVARSLCKHCGHALVSTSANLAGRPPARTALGVRRHFGDRVDYIVNAAVGDLDAPTSIRDLTSDEVLR